jgi:hypothetical protein
MKVHPRLAMELARHSDMRLTMKTYTDVGQLPLREVMDTLPGFSSDSRIDSRTLGATGQTVSPTVPNIGETKSENSIENIGESRGLTPVVALCHSEPPSGDREFESPSLRQIFRGKIWRDLALSKLYFDKADPPRMA